jgi:hypothetical protein
MDRLQYTGFTRANRGLAWQLFSDWRRWHQFSDVYGDIRWQKGAPWEPGSRLRIEVVRPVKAIVDHVITVCSPPEFVAWIDHALGDTMEQWVTFYDLADGGTRIHTWADITGPTLMVAGRNVRDVIRDFMRGWYDNFCAECDKMAEEAISLQLKAGASVLEISPENSI